MIFEMSSSLKSSAEKLLIDSERDHMRRVEKKRFALGFTPQELDGLYVGDAPLTNQRLSRWTDPTDYQPPVSESAGRAPLQTMTQKWADFVSDVKQSFHTEALERNDVSNFLEELFERNQLKEWVRGAGTSHGNNQVVDMDDLQVIIKDDDEINLQIDYLKDAIKSPTLVKSIVPIIYWPLPRLDDINVSARYVGIMPFLDRFVSLHDVIRQQSQFSKDKSCRNAAQQKHYLYPRDSRECQMVFEAVARELSEFLTVPPETHPPVHLYEKIMERIEERFSTKHETPILMGSNAYEKMYSEICSIIPKVIDKEDRSTFIGLGHGDLNATNIMVALNRSKSGTLHEDDILVRFIDANPEKRVYDATFELSRLLHWVELGTILREGRDLQPSEELYSVHLPDCKTSEEFQTAVPKLRLRTEKLQRLRSVYKLLLKCLNENVYFLNRSKQRHYQSYGKLSIGISMYHLVATRYWSRNVERLAAFLTASTELRRLQKPFHHGEPCGSDFMRQVRSSILTSR